MQVFQGEPIGFKINRKVTAETTSVEEHYVPSFADYEFEALMKDSANHIIKTWKTADESITKGTETIDGETAAYAAWNMLGSETKDLRAGLYSIELSRIVEGGRGIGVACDVVLIKEALIKEGV